MFRKINDEPDLAALDDFIEKPIYNCTQEELQNNVKKILVVLDKKPVEIMNIITNSVIPATFVLEELVDKMKNQNCGDKLAVLFTKHLDNLVEACVCNSL